MIFEDGTYKILYIKIGTDYLPIGCLSDNSFSENVDMLDTTTRDNVDGWKSSIPTGQTYDIDFNGVLSLSTDGTTVTYKNLQTLKRGRTKIEWKIENGLGGDIDLGSGYFTNISNSASIGEFVTFNGAITGFGQPLELVGNQYIDSDYIDDYYI